MSAKVLFWDIETAPILAYVWGTFEQNVSLDQIHTDWHVLAWAAKWKDSKEVMYMDQRNAKDITNDKKILEGLWKLLDEADVVVTQNGIQFDAKKVNARFIEHGMKPPSPYKHVDTLRLAKKQFGFTSNKLAYMTNKLCEKYKKLDHGKFPGFSLWQECLKGNKKAWKEMETYNKHDVLALEELYGKLAPWGAGYDPNVYTETFDRVCGCGASHWHSRGYTTTTLGKFKVYQCQSCGFYSKDKTNLLSKEKVASMKELQAKCFEAKHGYSLDAKDRVCQKCGKHCRIENSQAVRKDAVLVSIRCTTCRYYRSVKIRGLTNKEKGLLKKEAPFPRDCLKCGAKQTCVKTSGLVINKDEALLRRVRCRSCSLYSYTPLDRETYDPKNQRRSK